MRSSFFMGNGVKAPVETVETYCLKLETRLRLDLLETPYVPSLSRKLVSLSKLDVTAYSFNFGNGCFNLFKHNHLIGTGILVMVYINWKYTVCMLKLF